MAGLRFSTSPVIQMMLASSSNPWTRPILADLKDVLDSIGHNTTEEELARRARQGLSDMLNACYQLTKRGYVVAILGRLKSTVITNDRVGIGADSETKLEFVKHTEHRL